MLRHTLILIICAVFMLFNSVQAHHSIESWEAEGADRVEQMTPDDIGIGTDEGKTRLMNILKEFIACKRGGGDCSSYVRRFEEWKGKNPPSGFAAVIHAANWDDKKPEMSQRGDTAHVVAADQDVTQAVRREQGLLRRVLHADKEVLGIGKRILAGEKFPPGFAIASRDLKALYDQLLKAKTEEERGQILEQIEALLAQTQTRITKLEGKLTETEKIAAETEDIATRTVASVDTTIVATAEESTQTVADSSTITSQTTQQQATSDPDLSGDPTQNTAQQNTDNSTTLAENTNNTAQPAPATGACF